MVAESPGDNNDCIRELEQAVMEAEELANERGGRVRELEAVAVRLNDLHLSPIVREALQL